MVEYEQICVGHKRKTYCSVIDYLRKPQASVYRKSKKVLKTQIKLIPVNCCHQKEISQQKTKKGKKTDALQQDSGPSPESIPTIFRALEAINISGCPNLIFCLESSHDLKAFCFHFRRISRERQKPTKRYTCCAFTSFGEEVPRTFGKQHVFFRVHVIHLPLGGEKKLGTIASLRTAAHTNWMAIGKSRFQFFDWL